MTQQPTKEQIDSLEKLLTSLARKYSIDPFSTKTYHVEKLKQEPYIENITNYSIV
ncbi:MAG: hypothetical protein ACOZBL_03230 [Patescibacteria group bacterium]